MVAAGYYFTGRMAELEQRSAEINARYTRAQDLLTTVRGQVLMGSVYVRDALLDPNPATADEYRRQLEESAASGRPSASPSPAASRSPSVATFYASRLERRIQAQRLRDVETTRDLQRLSSQLLTAQDEERRSIARELHDEVGQVLTAIKVELAPWTAPGRSLRVRSTRCATCPG